MKQQIAILSLALTLASCEKTISLSYKDNQSTLIIEGNITDQPGPYDVRITRSIRLTETGAYPMIDTATVTLTDNAGNSETLAATGNGTYRTSTATGIPGRTYTLSVQTANQTYTAQSTMPQQVPFDSIRIEKVIFTGETEYNIIPVYNDPVTKGNNYRFVLSVNGKLINQHFIQNDDVRNGVTNSDRLEINDDDLKLKTGDQISITMQCVDAKVALYYKTLALIGDSGPGGGTTPNNPPNNLSNGALGLFSAHTTETRTITIP